MRVLIVEDEIKLARNIAKVLTEEAGYAVDVSNDGTEGKFLATSNPYDLLILDIMLPGCDGLEILKSVRNLKKTTAILLLTARDSRDDIVNGLDLGCDDYLTKPFDMLELLARCRALIRRSYAQPYPLINMGDICIDTNKQQVKFQNHLIDLSAMEYRLLEYLAHKPNQIISKSEIEEHLYDFGAEIFSNVVEVYVSTIRKKFNAVTDLKIIKTMRNRGYMLELYQDEI
ncbi:MAG: response regulator transcription factor [Phycisphaerae bacterium]|nr:response regulator transcription factor [Phycisphaerae bacterium]